jgi:hypothetical protein
MTVATLTGARVGHLRTGLGSSLLGEGYRLLAERLWVYAALALACATSAATAFAHVNILRAFSGGSLAAVVATPPINAVLALAGIAIFFILPSALRQIQPGFRMTAWRAVVALVALLGIGFITELGYAAAILPGIVVGVLLSQTLIAALLRSGERTTVRDFGATLAAACRSSFLITRHHFWSTLGIVAASLAILAVPFFVALVALVVLDVVQPISLLLTAPLLFWTFIYFECVRYALLVRWYRHLAATA